MSPSLLALTRTLYPQDLKIFTHLTGRNEAWFVGLVCICIDFGLLTGLEAFPVLESLLLFGPRLRPFDYHKDILIYEIILISETFKFIPPITF